MNGPERKLTELLKQWREGDEHAASQVLAAVYGDLRRVAGKYMRGERPDHTLQATALVHEAWMRLSHSPSPPVANREQFFRAMAAYMRRHLVDHARRRRADKRGAGVRGVALDDSVMLLSQPVITSSEDLELDLVLLDAALERLGKLHPRAARVLELRFFASQSIEEVAATLSVGSGTIKRDFAFARSFLVDELAKANSNARPG